MSGEIDRQSIIDEEHLRMLSLGYKISAGAAGLFALFGLLYVGMGAMIGVMSSRMPMTEHSQPPPAVVGWIFAGFGLAFFLILGTVALLKLRIASCLKRRTSKTFCMVVAAIGCLEFPYGTALGVLTFIVLGRETVSRLFEAGGVPPPTS
jgi:ABC-type branched-subunit amino acid transport system permease subunit